MAATGIGAGLNKLFQNNDSPKVTRTESGDTVERVFNLRRNRVKEVTDALTFGTADGEYTNAVLTSIQAAPIGALKSEVTLRYEPAQGTAEAIPPVGTVVQEIDANPIDIPIGALGLSEDIVADKKFEGIEGVLSPQPIYRRTEILSSFTFSETNAINNVGKIDNTPEGLTSPTSGKWLKVGFVVRSVGSKFEKSESWQYAENGWDTDIYSSVA